LRKLLLLSGLPLLLLLLLPLAGSSSKSIRFKSDHQSFTPALKRWLTHPKPSSFKGSADTPSVFYMLEDLHNPKQMFESRLSANSFSKQLAALTGGISGGTRNISDTFDSNLNKNYTFGSSDSKFSLSTSLGSPQFFIPNSGASGNGGFFGGFASQGGGDGNGGSSGSGGSDSGDGSKGSDVVFKPEYLEPPNPDRTPGFQDDPNGGNPPEDNETSPTVLVPEPESFLFVLFGISAIALLRLIRSY
jgi:hypothetical protein